VSDEAAPDPEIACHAKTRYPAESVANEVAANCFRLRGFWLRVYACTECGGYHLTKTRARPPLNANWAPPKKSQRALAEEAKKRRRRR
jgi:hypothetical protein